MIEELSLQPVRLSDAEELAALQARERGFLAPYEPFREESFYTVAGQREHLAQELAAAAAGIGHRFVIRLGQEAVGTLGIRNIVRGAFQSAHLGYFVGRAHNGRGIATRAVGLGCEWAFGEGGLHRLEAGTLVANAASRRVLEKNGFVLIGISPAHLRIAGRWQDHALYARVRDE